MIFKGKTVVITGAASGIGLLCAQYFAEKVTNVVMLHFSRACFDPSCHGKFEDASGPGS